MNRYRDLVGRHPVRSGLFAGIIVFIIALILKMFEHQTIWLVVGVSIWGGLIQYGVATRQRRRRLESVDAPPSLTGPRRHR
jgi:hypothetical protein